jgi:thiol-disulfide isomerase/thioredoxin
MRTRLFYLLCAGMWINGTALAQAQAGRVHISGILQHFNNQEELRDASEFEYLLPRAGNRMVAAGADGNFSIGFALDVPGYYRIGRNTLYLSPGDDLQATIDYNDGERSFFSGRGSAAANYLRGIGYPKAGSFIGAGSGLRPTARATIAFIEESIAARKKMLDTLGGVTPEFKRLEYARLRADAINSYALATVYKRFSTRNKDSVALFNKEFDSLAAPLVSAYRQHFVDASLLPVEVYRDIAQDLLKDEPRSPDSKKIEDWYAASALVEKMNETNDKLALAAFRGSIDSLGTTVYREALNRSLDALLKFGRGDLAADFEAIDMAGRPARLSSLKGKLIYVDIWATWCGPCMAEMPAFEELKAKFKDDPSVAFVSLSIDADKGLWESSVKSRLASGLQWRIDPSRLNAYNIVGVPRTLLIDKQFRMIDISGGLPSDPGTEKEIKRSKE